MATSSARGTSATAGSTGTWASTTNAYDGAVGTNPGTFATWTNASRNASGTITIEGDTFSGVTGTSTINSVSCKIEHKVSTTTPISSITVQLQDSTGANIGSAATATISTTAHADTLTLGTPTASQAAAGLWVLVTCLRKSSTTSSVFSLDYVDVTVNYTNATPSGFFAMF